MPNYSVDLAIMQEPLGSGILWTSNKSRIVLLSHLFTCFTLHLYQLV